MVKEDHLLTQGSRLRKLREQTGLTREKFSEIVGISQHTLKGWEVGTRKITNQKALLLANIFKILGIDTTPETILYGKEHQELPRQEDFLNTATLTEEDRIRKEVSFFKEHNYSYVLYHIEDSSMSPYFKEGDIVGGSKTYKITDFNKYQGQCCIIETQDNRKIARKVINVDQVKLDVCILNLDTPGITKPMESIHALSLASITRHWRLSEIL
jgi:transcriptional regulator with XRE-family HTH domain